MISAWWLVGWLLVSVVVYFVYTCACLGEIRRLERVVDYYAKGCYMRWPPLPSALTRRSGFWGFMGMFWR